MLQEEKDMTEHDKKTNIGPKPCPFCGGQVSVIKPEPRLYRPARNHPYSIACYNCNLLFGFDEDYGGDFDTEEEAVKAWNTRAGEN